MRVSEVWVYPIKSCRGIRLDQAEYDATGFKYDRHWMVVDERTHLFQTARTVPRMVLIGTKLTSDTLEVTVPAYDGRPASTHLVPLHSKKGEHLSSLRIWSSSPLDGYVAGDEQLAEALDHFFGKPVLLVQKGDDLRPTEPSGLVEHLNSSLSYAPQVAWQDGFPFLLSTEESIQDLRSRIPSLRDKPRFDTKWLDPANQLESVRFRPNIIIEGAEAWEEDEWASVSIGEAKNELMVVTRCARCSMPSVDPETAERDKVLPEAAMKPDRLALCPQPSYQHSVFFGMNALPLKTGGTISVGDDVVILKRCYRNEYGQVVRPEDSLS